MRIRSMPIAVLTAACLSAAPANLADLRRAFEHPPDDARIMMRWWWFGPAVTKPELEREMRTMKEGGIGGFELQPVYPLALDDPAHGFRNMPYLSSEFLEALRFTAEKARELGLRFDLTLGSGWPFGGPHIPIAQAAGRLRIERVPVPAGAETVPVPKTGAGEKLLAAFVDGRRIEDTGGNAARLPAAAAPRTALFFIASRTRMMVKRAAAGAEGLVLDHYDRNAIETHLKTASDPMMAAVGRNRPYAVFSDSLEVYGSDWTGDLLEQFQKRRGYDLTPLLTALAGDTVPQAAAIRHDWGRTLTELANERYLAPLEEWAARNGTRFRSQTYGIPPVSLSSNVLVDLPEGEGWQWRRFSATRWAASAAHLYGKPVVSSETWTWLHSPAFRAAPLDMKAEADLHFLQGINQLVGHGWPYSPPEAGEPGWRFYAAAVFNQHNPWWLVMPDIALYLQRVSFLLRQGKPANDVAVYLPTDDAWAGFAPGRVSINQAMDGLLGPDLVPQILDAGYDFDFIDDGAIARGGVPYPVLILPGVERIPLATLRKLAEYARGGGILVATRRAPSLAPGLKEAETEAAQIRELSRALFEGGKGRLVREEAKLGAELHAILRPDLAAAPEIGFVHRKLEFAEVYFIANTSNRPVRTRAAFRLTGLEGAWWDPFTGEVAHAGGNEIVLDLAPYESRVLVFSKERGPVRAEPAEEAAPITGPWQAAFPGSQTPVAVTVPHSWTDEPARKYFSGEVAYATKWTVAASLVSPGRRLYLDFGEGTRVTVRERNSGNGMRAMLESPVREAAVVYVNDKPAGTVWRPPYRVEVTGLIHAGENSLRVVVANTAINELAKGPLPDYRELNARYGERFQPQDMDRLEPLPSGLLGPVRLVAR
jgi:hypothetical protein